MGSILQKLDRTLETKEAIRQAIAGKGQAVTDTDPFSSYPEKISAIQTGVQLPELTNPGSAADLLAGKQLVDQYGNPLTGTMPQKSASDLTASGASIIVPAGYYPSQVSKSVVTATHPKPTISRSGGTITASHVQSAGYTEGGTTTGTLSIPTQAGTTITPGTSKKTAVSSGRITTGTVYVNGDANLRAENIKQGVSIFGITGNLAPLSYCSVTIRNSTVAEFSVDFFGDNGINIASGSSKTIEIAVGSMFLVRQDSAGDYFMPSSYTEGIGFFHSKSLSATNDRGVLRWYFMVGHVYNDASTSESVEFIKDT